MTTINEVREFIGHQADLAQLNELKALIEHAKQGKAMSLGLGARVKLKGLRPKYLEGLTGEIVGFRGNRLLFKPDVPQPRFGNPMTVPLSGIEPLQGDT
jgi:hypothetical protein